MSARCQHLGDSTRDGLLRVAEDRMMIGAVGCPVDWTLQAARTVITDDRHLLLPLLADADPEVRAAAVFVLALAIGETSAIESALHRRLGMEDDPAAQASLVLALAQLGRERRDERTVAWAREWWSDPERQRHVRIAAGIAWLCLVDEPAPDELRAFLTDPDTARHGCLFQWVPWFRPVDPTSGLRLCVHDMLAPHAAWDPSPWPD
ncbi:HEAT repeat domain-containing protein [Uniformispora flossi]|uniref:HEAT repeat domain-containing protein n=1 Tax=Uniformispora flossi TaxID=3390723 RepID=UPI003C2F2B1E